MDIERFLASDCGVRGQRGGVVRQTGIFRHRLGPSSPGLVTSPVSADLAWPQMRTIALLGSSQHPLRRKSSPEWIRKMSICSLVSMARSASSSRDESFKRLQRLFCGYSRFPSWRRAHKRRQEHGFQRRRPAPCSGLLLAIGAIIAPLSGICRQALGLQNGWPPCHYRALPSVVHRTTLPKA